MLRRMYRPALALGEAQVVGLTAAQKQAFGLKSQLARQALMTAQARLLSQREYTLAKNWQDTLFPRFDSMVQRILAGEVVLIPRLEDLVGQMLRAEAAWSDSNANKAVREFQELLAGMARELTRLLEEAARAGGKAAGAMLEEMGKGAGKGLSAVGTGNLLLVIGAVLAVGFLVFQVSSAPARVVGAVRSNPTRRRRSKRQRRKRA